MITGNPFQFALESHIETAYKSLGLSLTRFDGHLGEAWE
jgi:hypothetical protein